MFLYPRSLFKKAIDNYIFECAVLAVSAIFLSANLISPLNDLSQLGIYLAVATVSLVLYWRLFSPRESTINYPVVFLCWLNSVVFLTYSMIKLFSIIEYGG